MFYRENLLGSSDNLLESGGPAADKLHRQATASSFGSDEDSSNEDQVYNVMVCMWGSAC